MLNYCSDVGALSSLSLLKSHIFYYLSRFTSITSDSHFLEYFLPLLLNCYEIFAVSLLILRLIRDHIFLRVWQNAHVLPGQLAHRLLHVHTAS